VQRLKLDPHLHAQLGVQVRQRFVEQEDLGVLDDGPPDGDPLALAARQMRGLAVKVVASCSTRAASAIRRLRSAGRSC
jgi:hypothetical protein